MMAANIQEEEGGHDIDFISTPDDSLNCTICLLVARDPRQHGKCGQLFCQTCLKKYKKEKKDCPYCKEDHAEFFEDNRSQRQIKSLLVRCDYRKDGCTWEGELRSSVQHVGYKCQYREVECPMCEDKVKWVNLANHQESECTDRSYECPGCREIGQYWYITGGHMEDCLMVLCKCPAPGCDVEISNALLNFHTQTDCKFTLVECKYKDVGCTVALRRKDMEDHENNDKCHLQIITGSLTSLQKNYNDLSYSYTNLAHSYDDLEDLYDNLASSCDDLKCSLASLQMKVSDQSLYHTRFKIHNFSAHKKLNIAVQFKAGPTTYNLKATLASFLSYSPDGEKNLYMRFDMMAGENDDDLQWPFSGNIQVELLNQLEDKHHYTKTIPIPRLDRVELLMPDTSIYSTITSTKYYDFISYPRLLQCGRYWPNWILYFRMTVKSDCCKRWLE